MKTQSEVELEEAIKLSMEPLYSPEVSDDMDIDEQGDDVLRMPSLVHHIIFRFSFENVYQILSRELAQKLN